MFSNDRSFEEVPWDNMLAPKLWAPTSTLEERPDMISQTYTLHRYDPAAREWQVIYLGNMMKSVYHFLIVRIFFQNNLFLINRIFFLVCIN